jgi:hypothetical protein
MALKRSVNDLERQVEALESSNSSLGKQVSCAAAVDVLMCWGSGSVTLLDVQVGVCHQSSWRAATAASASRSLRRWLLMCGWYMYGCASRAAVEQQQRLA